MLETIVLALLPAITTIALGFFAARHHDFGPPDAPILIRMVITYALPISLFVDVVSRSRAELVEDAPLAIVFLVAIVGLYAVIFVLARYVFRLSLGMSALGAMAASAPNLAFLGPTVLGYLYGTSSNGPVALGNIISFVTVVPLTLILLSIDSGPAASADGAKSRRASIGPKVVQALLQPVVWLPLIGVAVVLGGFTVPKPFDNALALLGGSAAGVALFAAGIVLASNRVTVTAPVLFVVFAKNILQPGLVFVCLLLLGYGNPVLDQAVVAMAIPAQVLIAMLAVQYKVAPVEFASVLFISTVGSLVTMSGFIALTGG